MEEPRSYARVARDLHKSVPLIGGWGRKWRWQARLEAYLCYLEKVQLAERLRTLTEMNERHASVARLALEKISEALNSINGSDISPMALSKLLATSVGIERMARGIQAFSGAKINELGSTVITPSTKLVTLFNWRHIGRGVHKNSSSPPWAEPA
jgi:hypothetical protein